MDLCCGIPCSHLKVWCSFAYIDIEEGPCYNTALKKKNLYHRIILFFLYYKLQNICIYMSLVYVHMFMEKHFIWE